MVQRGRSWGGFLPSATGVPDVGRILTASRPIRYAGRGGFFISRHREVANAVEAMHPSRSHEKVLQAQPDHAALPRLLSDEIARLDLYRCEDGEFAEDWQILLRAAVPEDVHCRRR